MNSQVDFADLKSRFFIQPCSCGNSDKSYFSNIKVDGEVLLRECKKCHDTIGLDDSTYDEVLSWLGDTDNIRVSLCDCGNENPNTFVFEQLDDDIVLRCGECGKNIRVSNGGSTDVSGHPHGHTKIDPKSSEGTKTKCVPSHISMEAVGHPYGHTKIDAKSAWKLNPGDHVAWNRPGGYEHHAIVVRCSVFDNTYVLMIQYASPEEKRKWMKGEIIEDWVDLFKQKGDMYRVDYKPGTVLDSEEVIKRARERLGEVRYNVFGNNCEHFARWCKTGVRESEQVVSFASTAIRTGVKSLACAVMKVGTRQAVKQSFIAVARTAARTTTGKSLARVVSGGVAAAVIVGIELISFGRAVHKARDQLRRGKISQQECINIVVKRGSRAVGATAGAVAGSFIPVPVVGTLVGCTLGSVIGNYVGVHAGRGLSSLTVAKVKR